MVQYYLLHSPKNIWGGGERLDLFYVDIEGEVGQVMEKSKMDTDFVSVKEDMLMVVDSHNMDEFSEY